MLAAIGAQLMSDTPMLQCSPAQNLVADEFMDLAAMPKRRPATPLVLQGVLPEAKLLARHVIDAEPYIGGVDADTIGRQHNGHT